MRRAYTVVPLLLLLALAGVGASAPGSDAAAAGVLEGVQRWLDGTRDLQGKFEQRVVSGALGSGLAESGNLWIERPGRMRWDYLDPERKVALVRDDKTWFYLEDDEQLIRGRLEPGSDLLPALLTGGTRLDALFDASLAEPGDASTVRLELVPRGGSEHFVRVVLTVPREDFSIREAEVLDAAGNEIHYRFVDLRRNSGLAPETFVFEPPPGTLVSGQH